MKTRYTYAALLLLSALPLSVSAEELNERDFEKVAAAATVLPVSAVSAGVGAYVVKRNNNLIAEHWEDLLPDDTARLAQAKRMLSLAKIYEKNTNIGNEAIKQRAGLISELDRIENAARNQVGGEALAANNSKLISLREQIAALDVTINDFKEMEKRYLTSLEEHRAFLKKIRYEIKGIAPDSATDLMTDLVKEREIALAAAKKAVIAHPVLDTQVSLYRMGWNKIYRRAGIGLMGLGAVGAAAVAADISSDSGPEVITVMPKDIKRAPATMAAPVYADDVIPANVDSAK